MKRWGILLCLLLVLSLTACADGVNSAVQNASVGTTDTGSDSTDTSTEPAAETSGEDGSEETPAARPFSVFSTTDLEGNAVDQSILEGYDLTLVNVWATYCTPCLEALLPTGSLVCVKAVSAAHIASRRDGLDHHMDRWHGSFSFWNFVETVFPPE